MTSLRAAMVPSAAAMLAAGLLSMPRATAHAQSSGGVCTASVGSAGSGSDVCQKGRDLFTFVAPQIGVAVAGGNPTLGDAGSLGGPGKASVSFRVTAVDGQLPRNAVPLSAGGATASDFGAQRTYVPMPALDVALGLFPGVPLGLTNVGGVDLLVGATLLPSVSRNSFALEPDRGGIGFSYGVRIGVLQESSLVPGVSVSVQRRQIPTTDFAYTPGNDTLSVSRASVHADAYRVVVSKRLVVFGLAAGAGQDRISGSSDLNAVVNEAVLGTPVRQTVSLTGLRERTTRSTVFANATLNVLLARVVFEYGWSGAGSVRNTLNTFSGRAVNEGHRYGSIGVTARF